MKHLVLGEGYFRRLLPATLQEFNPLNAGLPGWNGVHLCTRWTEAEANVRGFASGPTAIALAAGLPLASPNHLMVRRVIPLPIGLNIDFSTWYDTAEKCDWFNWELMFGAAKGDGNALKLLKIPDE